MLIYIIQRAVFLRPSVRPFVRPSHPSVIIPKKIGHGWVLGQIESIRLSHNLISTYIKK